MCDPRPRPPGRHPHYPEALQLSVIISDNDLIESQKASIAFRALEKKL